jgi:hypothetical protein
VRKFLAVLMLLQTGTSAARENPTYEAVSSEVSFGAALELPADTPVRHEVFERLRRIRP